MIGHDVRSRMVGTPLQVNTLGVSFQKKRINFLLYRVLSITYSITEKEDIKEDFGQSRFVMISWSLQSTGHEDEYRRVGIGKLT